MLTEERQAYILELVKEKGAITVNELTTLLGASESTIRRDLNSLDEIGKLKKVHGGATLIEQGFISNEDSVSVKEQLCIEEKKAIASYAATMIHEDDFVFIDAGTSTEWLIEYIVPTKATFVTNGIVHAQKMLAKNLRTYVIGGLVKATTHAIIGAEAVNNMKKFNFTKSFIGTNGVHPIYGFTTLDIEEAMVKMEAINRSHTSIILADHTKFDKYSAVTFADIEKACVITDKLLNEQYREATIIKEVR